MKADFKVEGLENLRAVLLRDLPAAVGQKVVTNSLKRAARPMVRTIRTNYRALGGSGALAQATSTWQRRKGVRNAETFASVEIGPKRSNKAAAARYAAFYRRKVSRRQLSRIVLGKAKGVSGIRHGHLVEYGFDHRGGRAVPGKGIMGKAFDQHQSSVVGEFSQILGAEIDRAVRKMGSRQRARS